MTPLSSVEPLSCFSFDQNVSSALVVELFLGGSWTTNCPDQGPSNAAEKYNMSSKAPTGRSFVAQTYRYTLNISPLVQGQEVSGYLTHWLWSPAFCSQPGRSFVSSDNYHYEHFTLSDWLIINQLY